ncbi:MAG: AAA family ATPase [Rubrivivax sp.]
MHERHERHEGLEGQEAQGAIGIHRRFALAATQRGFTVVALAAPPGEALAIDFVLALYRSLRGRRHRRWAALGAQRARQRHGIAALARVYAEVHGDADRVARPLHGSAAGEDNVRQVTSLSFDLVGSTRLIDELRAERYSEVWTTYQRLTAGILARHGGAADNPQGDDGFMCYFGLHSAREDAATRAVQAALEVIDAVAALGVAVRIGGSTGEVVVRDGLPFGRSVNFAARLQSIAAPGTLLVAESTMKLARGRYRFERLADVPELKGFPEHEAVFRVAGPAAAHEEAVLAEQAGASPFVGRDAEMRALRSHWLVARSGRLRLVRLTGEAGIGKSRLLREFKRTLAAEGHEVIEYRCAAEHANSAWHPVVEALRHQLQIGAGAEGGNASAGEARVAHAHAALARLAAATAAPEEAAALLAALLGVPLPPGHALDSLPPERRRQRTLELLVELARLRARRAEGACMIVEDVHRVDLSTARADRSHRE